MKKECSNDIDLQACRAGYLQFDVKLGETEANLAAVEDGLADLKFEGPTLVALPELWAAGFDYQRMADHCRRTPEILKFMGREASRHGIYLAGSLPETGDKDDDRVFNTLFIVGPEGMAGKIRKQQLFAPMEEDQHFTAGYAPLPIRTDLGMLAGQVCFDLRFPDLTRSQAARGAQLMVVSGQWPAARREHWRTLLQARAIENQIFIVGCNRCGITGQTEFAGHSMVVAPDGTILSEAGNEPVTSLVDLEPERIRRSRKLFVSAGSSPYRFFDEEKVITAEALQERLALSKKMGRKVVFTNGCFDILHRGHVTYLEEARRLGDCLVVGLNSDESVRRLKGPDRPLNDENSRARVLAALGCVDHVVLFSEDTPLNLITCLQPDVLVKGGDWPVEKIVGASEVMARGGEVHSIKLVENFSTSGLISRISCKNQ